MRHAKPVNAVSWVEKLKEQVRVDDLNALALRFVYSLRLIAIHRRARRDPVPELAAKLGNVTAAIAALDLTETIAAIWPEPVRVGRACCRCLTFDEVTLARALEAVVARDRPAFNHQLEGLLKPGRIDLVWEQAMTLVAAELNAS
ncbi:DNA-directed RNA polymerase subunit beta' [Altererythrobacter sp. GH1-8]|uniref:DNA-directed RNA polymerase subunit beta' n=1 Tax=Altererythrobacter sp. GH1-8 TaxID=3349333 RepID=UPI00374DB969